MEEIHVDEIKADEIKADEINVDEMQKTQAVIETICSNGIARITLSRPPVNVLDISMMLELTRAFTSETVQRDARVVVIQATGKTFSAGVDVADHTPARMEEMLAQFHAVIRHIQECRVPTVALVKGSALGGGAELATSCDIVLASEGAKFGQPEIRLGVFPPVAMVNLPGTIGVRRAAEMIFTGNVIHATEAERIGLVNHVYEDSSFDVDADNYLEQFSRLSRTSLMQTKEAFRSALGMKNPRSALDMLEEFYLNRLMATHDAKEGIAAYLEKRAPVWAHADTGREDSSRADSGRGDSGHADSGRGEKDSAAV